VPVLSLGYRLGGVLRHAPLRALRVDLCVGRAGHFICPAVLVLMTMTYVGTPRVGGSGWGSPSGWGQGSSQGLPRRRASARLQAVPLVCRAPGRLAVLDLGLLPWFTLDKDKAGQLPAWTNGQRKEKRAAGAGLKRV
jgi:hypothetical protein